jgi:predicted Rossmann-fold nucleotide-binding protein
VCLLNVNGYYDPLLAMADRAVSEGFLKDVHRTLLLSDNDPVRLLERLSDYFAPYVDKWSDRAER